MIVYTLIFSQVMQARLPDDNNPYAYSIFLVCGLLPWTLFADIVSRGPMLFLDQANLLKKIQFPRLALLIIAVVNSLVNFGIIFGLFLLFLLISGQFPGLIFLTMMPVLLLQICLASSLCLILGILNIFFRDVAPITNIALQFGFWLTPIVYTQSMVPVQYQQYLLLNPLNSIFEAYHSIFIKQLSPQWSTLIGPLILCLILIMLTVRLYQKHGAYMVDEL
jgi:lipopolysaccharide transport system permease protein